MFLDNLLQPAGVYSFSQPTGRKDFGFCKDALTTGLIQCQCPVGGYPPNGLCKTSQGGPCIGGRRPESIPVTPPREKFLPPRCYSGSRQRTGYIRGHTGDSDCSCDLMGLGFTVIMGQLSLMQYQPSLGDHPIYLCFTHSASISLRFPIFGIAFVFHTDRKGGWKIRTGWVPCTSWLSPLRAYTAFR